MVAVSYATNHFNNSNIPSKNINSKSKILWICGGISKSQSLNEILGYDTQTNTIIKSNCTLSERQCHVMNEIDDGMILIGFGWVNKSSLNDL